MRKTEAAQIVAGALESWARKHSVTQMDAQTAAGFMLDRANHPESHGMLRDSLLHKACVAAPAYRTIRAAALSN